MLYFLVRPIARWSLRIYLGRIHVTGLEHIPAGRPVILAANHPTTFIEPCLLACYQPRSLWFLARGGLFGNPVMDRILAGLNILPVYRLRDGGYGKLKNNFDTFAACYRALYRRRALMILAEGRCVHEKRLRPLVKGSGRIALGTLAEHPDLAEVYIVPVAVNFTHADRLGSDVGIACLPPLLASPHRAEFSTNPNGAIAALTDDLAAALRRGVIHIADPADDRLVEHGLQTLRAGWGTDLPLDRQLAAEYRFVEWINGLPAAAKERMNHAADAYFARLAQLRIGPAGPAAVGKEEPKAKPYALTIAAVLLLLPQLPILAIAQLTAGNLYELEYYNPVRWAAYTIGLAVLLLLLPVMLLIGWYTAAAVLAVSIAAAPWSARRLRETGRLWHRHRAQLRIAPELADLKELRTAWQQQLGATDWLQPSVNVLP
ncbi:MAG: 1-acyl-sn-glycerol-3-phosphate acyltransferase [Saprospiraceae bacterium]